MRTDPHPHGPVDFGGKQWKAFRLGLRLSQTCLGLGVMIVYYMGWILIVGLAALVGLIPVVITGKADLFERVMNAVGLYGLVLPLALMAVAIWLVRLFSRFLWCTIPRPSIAVGLAVVAVAGRMSVLLALVYILLSNEPYRKSVLLPQVVACSAVAWLGLAAEWGFFRILRRHFISVPDPLSANDPFAADPTDNEDETDEATEQTKSIFKRDVGKWFKGRFPRGYKVVVWIVVPLGCVALSSGGKIDNLLIYAVTFPAILQVFWISGDLIELAQVFFPESGQEGNPAPSEPSAPKRS